MRLSMLFLLLLFTKAKENESIEIKTTKFQIIYSRVDSCVIACGKLWVKCGKQSKSLWKHWGIYGVNN
jgi:hypothetical protein